MKTVVSITSKVQSVCGTKSTSLVVRFNDGTSETFGVSKDSYFSGPAKLAVQNGCGGPYVNLA